MSWKIRMLKSKNNSGVKGEFLDLNVSLFINKTNGQWSVSIPKRKLKKLKVKQGEEAPRKIPIRLFRWWK
jgi:hypothetical protein